MTRLAHRSPTDAPSTVLVIDDDPLYVRSMTRLLGVEGYTARGETNPEKGVVLAAEMRPDVALVDYFMPVLTGDQVIARIRAFDPLVPCLVVSGYAGAQGDALRGDGNVQGVFGKAESPAHVVAWVRVWALAHRAMRALDPADGGVVLDRLTELMRLPSARRFDRALHLFATAAGGDQAPAAIAVSTAGPVLGAIGAYAGARSLEVTRTVDPFALVVDTPVHWTGGHLVVRWAGGVAALRTPEPNADALRVARGFRVVFQILGSASSAPEQPIAPWGA